MIGGDFQVEPKQLEDSGWVRAVGGFVVVPQLATVTPPHRVIDFFVVSRDLAGAFEATTHNSQHTAPHRPVRILVSTRLTHAKQRVMNRPKRWPAERPSGCRKRELDLDWDLVRRRVQAALGAQAGWTSFIDAEEELVDAFLIALDEAGAFCGRSQGQELVWKACKSPWRDKFPRGSYGMQSWRRRHESASTFSLLDCDWTNSCWARGTSATLALWGWSMLLVLDRQVLKLAAVPVSLVQCARRQPFWKLRLRNIATLPAWMLRIMEAEASGLTVTRATAGIGQIMACLAGGEHDRRCSEGAPAHMGAYRVPNSARPCG